ncbi:MAG: dihydropteroate synthase [Spirochaetes bacterium]|nr:dihydropteroate synthase [Spirochaetota bacterium]
MALVPASRTLVMGILNVTPDSFYDGGRHFDTAAAVERGVAIVGEGADIIDVGGESTRPGAESVPADEEIRRVCPVIRELANRVKVPVSVDTSKAAVAREALAAGAVMVNDISGLTFDGEMAGTVAAADAYLVVMHIRGTPRTMQGNTEYADLPGEIISFLERGTEAAMLAGVKKDKIIIDPGIGFGKTFEDNYAILEGLPRFRAMGYPVLVGLSRKSLIGRLYGDDSDRLPATLALNAIAAYRGADIVRVHDVREHVLAMKSVDMLKRISGDDGRHI